jgi:hypothetical protein
VTRLRAYFSALLLAGVLVSACNDPILPVGPENRVEMTNQPDAFRYRAWDLQNVHDTLRWTWTNNGPVAAVTHESFIPHGETVVSVREAGGVEVYHGPLESPQEGPLSRQTRPGRPGTWTIEVRLYGVDGARIDFAVARATPTPAPSASHPLLSSSTQRGAQ